MRNNIDAITKIYQPPKNSSGTPPANGWPQIEKQFGITFPYDFKKIIETYGSGAFSAFLFSLTHLKNMRAMTMQMILAKSSMLTWS
ncbi:hypothetical protein [Shewanella woodyi]|uniref:hypothetical protein n=1 Tax=Shewanella woodyi TaxID=60961 RepID=UPI003749753C